MNSGWIVAGAALVGIAFSGGVASAQSTNSFPAKVCDVREHGAGGTRIWFDTEAFQAAIDTCAKAGGGTVRVTRGEYLIGPIWLKSNIRLEIQKGAEVLAGTDAALFPQGERIGVINVDGAENVAIVGEGWSTARARSGGSESAPYGARSPTSPPTARPASSRRTTVRVCLGQQEQEHPFEGLRFENSPSFHLVINNSDYVTINRVRITAPAHAPNTDAIDPMNSRHIAITNNVISVGDDIVAIKSNGPDPRYPDAVSSDILIANNTILEGRGICIGSGSSGGVQRVRVENNTFEGSMYGLRIKSMRGKGGTIKDVVFKNNTMKDVETPLVFTSYYEYRPLDLPSAEKQLQPGGFILGNQIWPGPTDPAQPFVQDKTPDMSGIVVDGVTATGADLAGIIVGLPEKAIGITLKNIKIEAKRGLLVRNAEVVTQGVAITSADKTPFRSEAGGVVKAAR
jgi:polygalacturonase